MVVILFPVRARVPFETTPTPTTRSLGGWKRERED
jgi:hypothetical protein